MTTHASRKADHLDLCATDDVAFQQKTTLFDAMDLVHDALPELAVDGVDLSTALAGQSLRAPIVIAAMTGGTDRAVAVNKDLASVAEEHGIGFGFGSMRPLLEDGDTTGYLVRDVAPTALLFGNLGIVQAREASTQAIVDMVGTADCNALCIHLNPAMEVVQPEGDDDFSGGLETIARIHEALDIPVIVKETGCGLSRSVGQRVSDIGIRWVDTSGAGGTSWVGVETLRAKARTRELGELFWDWGIPTAASVAQLSDLGLGIIATGGVRHGLDIAKAIALGATAGGMARPFLISWNEGGREAASAQAERTAMEIRIALLLAGARTPAELQKRPLVVGDALRRWVPAGTTLQGRLLG
ncbi:MAG: type 2 isopentenyl-diphosphate Delta-isomerase [Proteobacteria bacterium]|nr:type 2 isopentenyl-diphosphate Delta-isomerase [Pseudomonadota bacterium]